jgi:hypothetical protein
MYKVMSKDHPNELWGIGFYSKEKAQRRIDEGYYQKYMCEKDKSKKLIVV